MPKIKEKFASVEEMRKEINSALAKYTSSYYKLFDRTPKIIAAFKTKLESLSQWEEVLKELINEFKKDKGTPHALIQPLFDVFFDFDQHEIEIKQSMTKKVRFISEKDGLVDKELSFSLTLIETKICLIEDFLGKRAIQQNPNILDELEVK